MRRGRKGRICCSKIIMWRRGRKRRKEKEKEEGEKERRGSEKIREEGKEESLLFEENNGSLFCFKKHFSHQTFYDEKGKWEEREKKEKRRRGLYKMSEERSER